MYQTVNNSIKHNFKEYTEMMDTIDEKEKQKEYERKAEKYKN